MIVNYSPFYCYIMEDFVCEFRNGKHDLCYMFRHHTREFYNIMYCGDEIIIQTYKELHEFINKLIRDYLFVCVVNRSRVVSAIIGDVYFGQCFDSDVISLRELNLKTEELF